MTKPKPLGNLHNFVEGIAQENAPALSFLNDEFQSLDDWRALARGKAQQLLSYEPQCVAPEPHTIEIKDCGDYFREKIEFSTAQNSRTPAYVLIPKALKRPAPAVVALHCHGSYYIHGKEKLVKLENETVHLALYKKNGYGGRSIANELVQRGFIVIATDAFYFGERRLNLSEMPRDLVEEMQRRARNKTGVAGVNETHGHLEELTMRHLIAAGATWMGVMAHDDRTTVDYLLTRDDVDPDRIGCVGLSMGGMRTNWLHALDPRVKCSVSVSWMTDWREMLPSNIGNHSWAQYVPGLTGVFELSDLAVMGNGAFMAQVCAHDELHPNAGLTRTLERIQRLAQKANLSERVQTHMFDVTHQFNIDMQEKAFAWLERWLGI